MDYVGEITRTHFEEAFSGARRSVTGTDLAKYDDFRKKFDPKFKTSIAGGNESVTVIDWPDSSGATAQAFTAAADDDDDLYS